MADITDMGKKVNTTFSIASQSAQNGWNCSACGKSNVERACFCGGCGAKKISFNSKESPQVNPQVKTANSFEDFVMSFKNRIRKIAGNSNTLKTRNKTSFVFISIFIVFIVTIFLLKTISAEQAKQKAIPWAKIRIYLANHFKFSPAELDSALNISCSIIPAPDATIRVEQLLKVEQCLRKKIGIKSLSFFPNPYFELTVDSSGRKVFQDIPLDHPAYVALRPLLDLGVCCESEKKFLSPYNKMYRDDWNNIKNQFFTILALEVEKDTDAQSQAKGPMSNYELGESINGFRQVLGMKPSKNKLWPGEFFYPSRLEALSALAQLIAEIEG